METALRCTFSSKSLSLSCHGDQAAAAYTGQSCILNIKNIPTVRKRSKTEIDQKHRYRRKYKSLYERQFTNLGQNSDRYCILRQNLARRSLLSSFIEFECTNVLPLHVHLSTVALDLEQNPF